MQFSHSQKHWIPKWLRHCWVVLLFNENSTGTKYAVRIIRMLFYMLLDVISASEIAWWNLAGDILWYFCKRSNLKVSNVGCKPWPSNHGHFSNQQKNGTAPSWGSNSPLHHITSIARPDHWQVEVRKNCLKLMSQFGKTESIIVSTSEESWIFKILWPSFLKTSPSLLLRRSAGPKIYPATYTKFKFTQVRRTKTVAIQLSVKAFPLFLEQLQPATGLLSFICFHPVSSFVYLFEFGEWETGKLQTV